MIGGDRRNVSSNTAMLRGLAQLFIHIPQSMHMPQPKIILKKRGLRKRGLELYGNQEHRSAIRSSVLLADGVRLLFGLWFPCWSLNQVSNGTVLGQPSPLYLESLESVHEHRDSPLEGSLCPVYAFIRKSVMSIKFPPVILGPEMAAPILWAPGIFGFFLVEMPIKFLLLGGGGGSWFFWKGAVEVPI